MRAPVNGMAKTRLPVIALDGPVGSGKSQLARRVAAELGLTYIDTGAMYRTVTLEALERGLDPGDASAVARLAETLDIRLEAGGHGTRVTCGGRDVSEAIRRPEVSAATSRIADNPGVRQALVRQQQALGRAGGVVMEGRDIGTVVFPDADHKFYVDAAPEERARRRYRELRDKGIDVTFDDTLAQLLERDRRDMSRPQGALRVAEGAEVIDTTGMTLDEAVAALVARIRNNWR